VRNFENRKNISLIKVVSNFRRRSLQIPGTSWQAILDKAPSLLQGHSFRVEADSLLDSGFVNHCSIANGKWAHAPWGVPYGSPTKGDFSAWSHRGSGAE
jgi:hypothetical protein